MAAMRNALDAGRCAVAPCAPLPQAEWKRPIYVAEANEHPSLTGGNIHMPKGSCEC